MDKELVDRLNMIGIERFGKEFERLEKMSSLSNYVFKG